MGSHTHQDNWTYPCPHCGKHIGFEKWVPKEIYCPNCWNLLQLPALTNPTPNKYNPKTGKLTEMHPAYIEKLAKDAIDKEEKDLKEKPDKEPTDSLITAYELALKGGSQLISMFGGSDSWITAVDDEDKNTSKVIMEQYIAKKVEIRKERGMAPRNELEKLYESSKK